MKLFFCCWFAVVLVVTLVFCSCCSCYQLLPYLQKTTFSISSKSFLFKTVLFETFPRIICKLSKEEIMCHIISLFCYFSLNQFRETLILSPTHLRRISIDQFWALKWPWLKMKYGLFFKFISCNNSYYWSYQVDISFY